MEQILSKKSLSNLLRAIREKNWEEIHLYLKEADLIDESGFTALHWVCCDVNIPVNIVRLLFQAFPDAALMKNNEGFTPLFLSVLNNNVDAARTLINAVPDSVSITSNEGLTSLHWAALSLTEIIDAVVDSKYSAVLDKDCRGETPMDYFFMTWNMHLRAFLRKIPPSASAKDILDMRITPQVKVQEIYDKTCLLLHAAYKTTSNIDEATYDASWLALHSSLQFESCPWAFSALLLRIHPEQLTVKDDNGNMPIHIITSASKSSDAKFFSCNRCGRNSKLLYHVDDMIYSDLCKSCFNCTQMCPKGAVLLKPGFKVSSMIQEILAIDPKSANIPDSRGKYPLQIALNAQNSFLGYDIDDGRVLKQLFYAAPDVIMKPDLSNNLLPFMNAGVGSWNEEVEQVNSIYFLLREDPSLLLL